ncbi:MAG: RluA family pseudouridine synthase [bacterium]
MAFDFTVGEDGAGQRVDVYLAARTDQTRSQIRRHIEAGAVLVAGRPTRPARTLRSGESVLYDPPPPVADEALPEEIPLDVLYEDEHLVVVDKPPGLVVHPSPGHRTGTLVNALLAHCGELSSVGGRKRPGIVHRLDKDTSGVMVASKTDLAHVHLARQFHAHSVERSYQAITVGSPPQGRGTFDTFHGRHPVHRKRFTSRLDKGRRAITHYEVRERVGGLCLIEARLETGRTHQVRVHLCEHGAPILGDPVYAKLPKEPQLRALAKQLGRQALHAAVLGLDHPLTGARMIWSSGLPEDMATVLGAARGFDPM